MAKRAQIVAALIEGVSLRATSRMADVSINTVTKLLVNVAVACADYQDRTIRGVKSQRVQCDEIWQFCYAKKKTIQKDRSILDRNPNAGDTWTFTAIDADTKLCISWLVGNRDSETANAFMGDVASRLANRVQLTTDQLGVYFRAVDGAFMSEVDFGMLHKIYAGGGDGRYSPAECIGCQRQTIIGEPVEKHISTSYVEGQNLRMRMSMRRFTRLTNGFSKKLENHIAAVALHFMHYNFARIHKTLRITPAMAAGVSDHVWSIEEMVALLG